MAAASFCGSRCERTTIYAWLNGDWKARQKHCRLLLFGNDCIFAVFHHTHDLNTRSVLQLVILPIALLIEPNILPAKSLLTTATAGALLSSCQVKLLPANKEVPAAAKYPGEMLYLYGMAVTFDSRRSAISSLKTFALLPAV